MTKPRPFDADARELASRLFTAATAMLEDATAVASAGQHPRLTAGTCAAHARSLQRVAADLAVLADAALVIAGAVRQQPRNSAPKRRA